ncbi:MAG: CoA transferase [Tissierellia bacterium]|nr:CoA transferase [Tissierellia bacterium]
MDILQGIKVVELGKYVATPIAGRLLSEWGAQVTKVEIGSGDPMRKVGKLVGMPTEGPNNPAFDIMNGYKKIISINTRTEEGIQELQDTILEADIFITNYRQKALDGLLIDYESIRKIKPSMVYGQVLGFGKKGAESDKPAYDFTAYYARGGISGTLHDKDSPPLNAVQSYGDVQSANYLLSGILGGYIKKLNTGIGSHIAVGLYHTALFNMGYLIAASQFGFKYPISRFENPSPLQGSYRTKDDRWIQLAIALHQESFDHFCNVVGHPELIANEEFKLYDRVSNNPSTFVKALDRIFLERDADEWIDLFEDADLPCEKLMYWEEILNDEQALDNRYIGEYYYGDKLVKMIHSPVVFNERVCKLQSSLKTQCESKG